LVRPEHPRITLRWTIREPPLPAGAVAAGPGIRDPLIRRLLARSDLSGLSAVAGGGWVVVLGSEALLPWADGARYLGRDPAAPRLWIPTTLAPNVPASLLEAAVARLAPGGPWALLDEPPRIVPLSAARALDRRALGALLEAA
jgi:hypothetical protein